LNWLVMVGLTRCSNFNFNITSKINWQKHNTSITTFIAYKTSTMKKIITLLAFLTLFSCSNDDDSGNDNSGSKTKKYVDRISLVSQNGSFDISLTYNADKQIASYTRGTTTRLSYEYQGGRLVRVNDLDFPDSPYQFTYNDGILFSLKHYNETYAVTYNKADKSYFFDGISTLKFGFSGKNITYVEEGNSGRQTFSYNNSKKGPLYNVDMDDLYFIPLLSDYSYSFLSASPLSEIKIASENTTTYKAENTYDDEGYLTSTVMRSGNDQLYSATYHYTDL